MVLNASKVRSHSLYGPTPYCSGTLALFSRGLQGEGLPSLLANKHQQLIASPSHEVTQTAAKQMLHNHFQLQPQLDKVQYKVSVSQSLIKVILSYYLMKVDRHID